MSNELERLQKVIAQSGVTSRRKAEQLILDGKVKVNQKVITKLGTKVSSKDVVEVNGIPLEKEKAVYYLFYKPREVISSVKDDKGRKVVTDYFTHVQKRIFPIGRLDYHTSGLLLLTNDGEFSNLLMHPRHQIEKVYVTKIKGIPSKDRLKSLTRGIKSDKDTLKAVRYKVLSIDKRSQTMILEVTLIEGKNRQVRRMMDVLGYPVLKLKREKYGILNLDGLQPGQHRPLKAYEINEMRQKALANVKK